MAYQDADARFAPSILDRLTDEEPNLTREVGVSQGEQTRRLRASLCRDLTILLNTKRREDELDAQFEQTRNSVLNYGLRDFTSCSLTNPDDQERIRAAIEQAIRRFEPRLNRVTVTLDPPSRLRPMLQFHVDAFLRVERPEPVRFDTVLDGDHRRFEVRGEHG